MPRLSAPGNPFAPAEWTQEVFTDDGLPLADQIRQFRQFDRAMFPFEAAGAGVLEVRLNSLQWQSREMTAMDAAQRVLTTTLGLATGIPILAEQWNQQADFLSMIPATESVSPIIQQFESGWEQHGGSIEAAFDMAYALANGRGLDALQGAISLTLDIMGAVPMVGWIAGAAKLAIAIGRIMEGNFGEGDWESLKVPDPGYSPDNDYNACTQIQRIFQGRDWTAAFLPSDPDYPDFLTWLTWVPAINNQLTSFPHFRGFRGEPSKEWIYGRWEADLSLAGSSAGWGYCPTWGTQGGFLWRGIAGSRQGGMRMIGGMLPTAQALGAQAWNTARNPFAPQCLFVDAKKVHEQWLRFIINLRRGLHWTHDVDAVKRLKELGKKHIRPYGDGIMSAQLKLNMTDIERGKLKRRRELRIAFCNALAPKLGWPLWSAADDQLMSNIDEVMAVSDDEYVERFDLLKCAPLLAANDLYRRQLFAVQTVTGAYATGTEPAFNASPDLRKKWEESLYNLAAAPMKLAAVDTELVPDPSFRQTIANIQRTTMNLPDAQTVAQWVEPGQAWTGSTAPPDALPPGPPRATAEEIMNVSIGRIRGPSKRRSGGAGAGLAIAAAVGLTLAARNR